MRSRVNQVLPLVLIAAVAGGGSAWARDRQPAAAPNGPAADYPVVLGDPIRIGGTTYTPADRLNYDAVGYADIGTAGGTTISGAHKTLPLPSYVEVTSLVSGRTILLRVERRGPMDDRLIELSPGAAAQLGVAGSAHPAVRVRRVNPPEQERAMLRRGGRAPERMETPKGLLDALNHKLASGTVMLSSESGSHPVPPPSAGTAAAPATAPAMVPTPKPAATPHPAPTPAPAPTPSPPAVTTAKVTPKATAPAHPAAQASLVVQVAAFSTEDRARNAAGKLGGHVSPAGRFWRVRLGPFATRAEAEAALAKAKAASYSDARILRAD